MEGGGLFSLRNKSLGVSKRIKISRACDECRKRKVKCDGVQPCGRCRKSNAECVFAKLPPKRGPPKQYMENLENRLQRVEKALKSITAPVRKVFEEKITEVGPFNNHKRSVSYSAPYTSDLHVERFTMNEIGQAIYVNDLKSRIDRIPKDYYYNSNNNNDNQSDVSDSPLSFTATSFYQTTSNNTNGMMMRTELAIPEHLSSRHIISEVQLLTEIYFDHVHKYVPMIHKPTFLKQMHNTSNPPSKFLLYAMCAVASRWSNEFISTNNNKIPAGYVYYQKALELLDDFMDSPRITTIQGIILLVKYQEYFQRTGYFHRSYFYLNIAIQMSFDLGLTNLEEDSETKRRTFWVLFMYDLLTSIEQGHLTQFEVKKCKIGFPLVTGEEGPALEELIINQNIFIQLGKVLSEIYFMSRNITKRQMNQGDKRTKEQTIEEQARLFSLHTHLENFLYEIPPTLIYPPTQDIETYPAEKQVIGDPFIGFLHMTYHFSVILLHRIYTSLSPPKTEYNFITYPHRKLCATSASNITTIAETLFEMYPNYTFSYPTRGVQHTIHCLSTASTIHKYEMIYNQDELMRESAKQQYILTLNIMQQLSNQSPSIEVSNYFNKPITNEEPVLYQSSVSIATNDNLLLQQQLQQQQQQSYSSTRYNTYPQMNNNNNNNNNNSWSSNNNNLYNNTQPIQITNSWNQSPTNIFTPHQYPAETMIQQEKHKARRHTVSFAPQEYLPNNNLIIQKPSTNTNQDTIMMDTPLHYDPTPGMSQLFLTDDQHLTWNNASIISTESTSIQRSEGHVMK